MATPAYRRAIAAIESAGSGGYSAIGARHPKLGRALGKYQIMEANIGPWSRKHLGREVSVNEFMANPAIQDAIFDAEFGSYVARFGPEGAAQAWFAGPEGVGKLNRQDVHGTSVGNYGNKFMAHLGGGAGSFPDAPMQDFTGPVSERPLASFNDMGGGFGQMFSGLPFGDPNAPPDPMRFGDVQGPYTPAQEYDEMGGTMMAGAPGTGGAWGGGSGGIPRSVSDYATNDKDDGFFSRMGRALTKMEQSQRPIGGGFRGGASNGNALLEVLNSPTIKDLLLKKRLV